jgi:hypothetical protein
MQPQPDALDLMISFQKALRITLMILAIIGFLIGIALIPDFSA